MNKKIYEVYWRDEVCRTVPIVASSKEEAYEIWVNGDWDSYDMIEHDCRGLSDKDEILNDMEIVDE